MRALWHPLSPQVEGTVCKTPYFRCQFFKQKGEFGSERGSKNARSPAAERQISYLERGRGAINPSPVPPAATLHESLVVLAAMEQVCDVHHAIALARLLHPK